MQTKGFKILQTSSKTEEALKKIIQRCFQEICPLIHLSYFINQFKVIIDLNCGLKIEVQIIVRKKCQVIQSVHILNQISAENNFEKRNLFNGEN